MFGAEKPCRKREKRIPWRIHDQWMYPTTGDPWKRYIYMTTIKINHLDGSLNIPLILYGCMMMYGFKQKLTWKHMINTYKTMKQKHIPTIHVKVYCKSKGSRKSSLSHLSHRFLQDHIFSGDVSNENRHDTAQIPGTERVTCVFGAFCLIKKQIKNTHTHITKNHNRKGSPIPYINIFLSTSF